MVKIKVPFDYYNNSYHRYNSSSLPFSLSSFSLSSLSLSCPHSYFPHHAPLYLFPNLAPLRSSHLSLIFRPLFFPPPFSLTVFRFGFHLPAIPRLEISFLSSIFILAGVHGFCWPLRLN